MKSLNIPRQRRLPVLMAALVLLSMSHALSAESAGGVLVKVQTFLSKELTGKIDPAMIAVLKAAGWTEVHDQLEKVLRTD